jgi:hypothetical protein
MAFLGATAHSHDRCALCKINDINILGKIKFRVSNKLNLKNQLKKIALK